VVSKRCAYRPGIALAATLDQSEGNIPKSSPYILSFFCWYDAWRFERRKITSGIDESIDAFRFEQRRAIAGSSTPIFRQVWKLSRSLEDFDF